MNFIEFSKKIEEFKLFETRELKLVLGNDFNRTTLINIKNWINKGYLIMVRKGLYILSDFRNEIDAMAIASKIYFPSYISLETALGYYGIIPEAVFTITSATSKKTNKFSTPLGNFSYQKIKKEAFGGFETKKERNVSFNLALPEKALTDFFYLNRNILNGEKEQFEGYRFSEDFKYNKNRLLQFAKQYKNKKAMFLTEKFIKYYVA